MTSTVDPATSPGRKSGGSSRRKNERELRLGYFAHVLADFHGLSVASRQRLLDDLPPGLRRMLAGVEESGGLTVDDEAQLDWGEIATFEDKILALQDDATVRRRTWQLRARYAQLVGADRYQAYNASAPPSATDPAVPADVLRADLRRLLAATHFIYSLILVREDNRRRVMRKVMLWTAALCAAALVGSASLLGFSNTALAGTICAVVVFGCVGAYISVQRRLQDAPDTGDPVIAMLGLYEFNSIQPFPIFAGGVFAIVLYFILAARFMEGTLFPNLGDSGVPAVMGDWAKLFIWSLLAGFAERLVPDTLDRLTNQARVKEPVTAPTPATVVAPDRARQIEADDMAQLKASLRSLRAGSTDVSQGDT